MKASGEYSPIPSPQQFRYNGFMTFSVAAFAVILTAIQLIPQTMEAIQDRDLRHLSSSTFIMMSLSSFLWILHGANIRDSAIIFANIVVFSCAVTILYMKFHKGGLLAAGKSRSRNARTARSIRVKRRR